VAVTCGPANTPLTSAQLTTIAEPVAALVLELPQRDLGAPSRVGRTGRPSSVARDHDAAAHMDGARLWEAVPFYASTASKSLLDIADLFDTVYVSFYKGLGAIAGCCVAGDTATIEELNFGDSPRGTRLGLWPYAPRRSVRCVFVATIHQLLRACASDRAGPSTNRRPRGASLPRCRAR